MKKLSFNMRQSVNKILVLLSSMNFGILGFHIISILIIALATSNFDIQVLLYLTILMLVSISFVLIITRKRFKNTITTILLIGIILSQIVLFFDSFQHPTLKKILDIGFCVDTGRIWDKESNTCSP